jgi:AraC-like DNA-binding protein
MTARPLPRPAGGAGEANGASAQAVRAGSPARREGAASRGEGRRFRPDAAPDRIGTAAGGPERLARSRPVDLVHAGAVRAICGLLVQGGIDPAGLLQQAGIEARSPGTIEAVPFAALGRLTALGAERTGCPHFGLLVGQRATLSSLGLLGVLMRHSETVGDALQALADHHGRLGRGAVIEVPTNGSLAIASYTPYRPETEGVALQCERALATMTALLRALCGRDWAPDEVLMPRREPPDAAPYAAFFRAPVRFGHESAALVFPARLLRRAIEDANPLAHRIAERRIRQIEAACPAGVTDEIRRRLCTTTTQKPLSGLQVAHMLAMHRRTLSRRLKAEGTSYRLVANETRLGLAKQLLADTDMSLAQISATLDFSEPAAFTHAFRRWTGTTPSAWRRDAVAPEETGDQAAVIPPGRVSPSRPSSPE